MGLSRPVFFCFNFVMKIANSMRSKWMALSAGVIAVVLLTGCSEESPGNVAGKGLVPVTLQTDWFPQAEHGGFYQALAKGYYADAGLDVTILPGGPNAMSTQKILKGSAQFAMNRADTIYSLARRDVPILMVMATLQHDPQGLLLHASNPIDSFEELDGERVMAIPGLAWISWIEAKYGISLDIIPHDFGIERFLNDESFIQQCLITNEPFYVMQAGITPRVMPLRESGFDPYHGIYCLREYAAENDAVVARFVEASILGWKDFILNDPEPAFGMIAERNPKMSREFMNFSRDSMRAANLVTGEADGGSQVGDLDPERMQALVAEMQLLGLVEESPQPNGPWYTIRYLPKPVDGPSGGPP